MSSFLCASMFINQLLAVNGSDIIYGGLGAAQETQESFDQLWIQILGGPAYLFVSKTAGTLAGIFVIVWLVFHKKDLHGDTEHLKHIFFGHLFGPILVFILLVVQINGFSVLGHTMLSIRNFSNAFTNAVLNQMAFQVTDPVQKGLTKIQAEQLATSGLQDCLKNANEAERNECLSQLQAKLDKTIAPYRDEQWAQDIKSKLDEQVHSLTENGVEAWLSDRMEQLGNLFGGLSDQVITSAILIICNVISIAATWLMEIIGLMTAFVGPMVIAFCLFPKFEEAWKPWIVGMVGVGGVSLLYKFSIGLVSIQVLNSTGPVQMIGPVCLALLGIVLVASFVLGGGVAAFQVGQSALAAGGATGARAGAGFVGGSARRVGKLLRR